MTQGTGSALNENQPGTINHQDQEQFRAVVETVNDGIITINSSGLIETFNPAAEEMFGYTLDMVVDKNINMLMPGHYQEEHDRYLTNYLSTGAAKILGIGREVLGMRRDGSVFPMELAVGEMHIHGETKFVGSCRDITERKQSEADIRLYTQQLEASNKELDAFSYSVSHDLRAPIRAMDGFSQILMEEYGNDLNDEARDYLDRIRKASQRMGQMVDDILALFHATRNELHLKQVSLSNLADEAIKNLRSADPTRVVEVSIKADVLCLCDSRLAQTVLENLIDNAWKFTGKTPSPRIQFDTTQQDGETVYFIKDNGSGFDMAYVDKLFGIFQRLHSVTEFSGNGIGLVTVSRLIQKHGGRVWAESAVNEGATFFFTLGNIEEIDL